MIRFQIGDIVRHNYSTEQHGTVTEIRDEKYSTYVKWDNSPERNDWYKPEVLVIVRGSVPQGTSPAVTLSDLGQGAIGISNSSQGDSKTPNVEQDTPFAFGG